MTEINYATRPELVLSQVLARVADLVDKDLDIAKQGQFIGNVLHHIGPAYSVFMMTAGADSPEYVKVGIAKKLPKRIRTLIKSSPIPMRVGVYTMVPSFKQALELRAEIASYLDQLFPNADGGWYHTPEGNEVVALRVITDVAGDHHWSSGVYYYHPKVKESGLEPLKNKLIEIKDQVELAMGGVM